MGKRSRGFGGGVNTAMVKGGVDFTQTIWTSLSRPLERTNLCLRRADDWLRVSNSWEISTQSVRSSISSPLERTNLAQRTLDDW